MNLPEFRAWFEGFTENMTGAPTERQWERIKEEIENISSEPSSGQDLYDRLDRYKVTPYNPNGYPNLPHYPGIPTPYNPTCGGVSYTANSDDADGNPSLLMENSGLSHLKDLVTGKDLLHKLGNLDYGSTTTSEATSS